MSLRDGEYLEPVSHFYGALFESAFFPWAKYKCDTNREQHGRVSSPHYGN